MTGAPAWVRLTRDLLESPAWRSLSINARRLIDFLLIEHMRHGGKENGRLLAPRLHLVEFGIGKHFITSAIEEVQRLGLVDCDRGVGRRPSAYTLTWLPLAGGTAPSNRWSVVGAVSTLNGCQTTPTKAVAGANQHPQGPKSMGAKQHPPSRYSYQGRDGLVTQKVEDRVLSLPRADASGKGGLANGVFGAALPRLS